MGRLPRWIDVAVATCILLIGAPLWMALAIIVRVSSPGPALHRAHRVGLYGETFELLKFRTMHLAGNDPAITARGDARITPIGRVLRATKLDEVPQLVNVLRGEMALVGPRPEDPRYVADYTSEQRDLLLVRPGLTSPASIEYRHEEAVLAAAADPERAYVETVLPTKLAIDLAWLAHRSLVGDLAIVLRTLRAIVR